MSDLELEERGCVTDLILPKYDLESDGCDNDRQMWIFNETRKSPILGYYFKLPEIEKSFDSDPPTLDSSLPYIPVYTHLKTFDPSPIERPTTPALINKLRSSGQPKKRSGSLSVAAVNGRADAAIDRADQTLDNDSERTAKDEDSDVTVKTG